MQSVSRARQWVRRRQSRPVPDPAATKAFETPSNNNYGAGNTTGLLSSVTVAAGWPARSSRRFLSE